MNFIANPVQGMRRAGRWLLFGTLSILFSQHVKRILFITSLYCYVARIEGLREEALEKLDRAMGLSKGGYEALRFPAAMRNMVWDGVDLQSAIDADILNHPVTDVRARKISLAVVKMTPRWIRYRSGEAMMEDVERLIDRSTHMVPA
jgi:hypothetical protein